MHAELPGRSSTSAPIALAKVALRVMGISDVADAIGDLTDLGRAHIDALVRKAERGLSDRPSGEFARVGQADREWAEGVASRSFIALSTDPKRRIMSESLIGPEAVAQLARAAMTSTDQHEVDLASEDVRAYLETLFEAIAFLVSDWYVSNSEANTAAMAQAAGETLDTVRELSSGFDALREYLESRFGTRLTHLEQASADDDDSTESSLIRFELRYDLTPLATDDEFLALVSAAAVAAVEGRRVRAEVVLPTLDDDLAFLQDPVQFAQYKRDRLAKASRIAAALTAFFSTQVEAFWSTYLSGVADRVTVARAIMAEQSTHGSRLDVWRTVDPYITTQIWLTPDELAAVLDSVGVGTLNHLSVGAGWRDAADLPREVIVQKVMPSILKAVVRQGETEGDDWLGDILFLPYWHIGQG